MNLIILEKREVSKEGLVTLTDNRASHIHKVIKATPGQKLRIGLINSLKGYGEIIKSSKHEVIMQCSFDTSPTPTNYPAVDLICALPRPQTVKDVLQIAATMQIKRIFFTQASRVETCYFSASGLEPAKMRNQMIKGLSQGKNTILPEIHIHKRFKPLISKTLDNIDEKEGLRSKRILFHPDSKNRLSDSKIFKADKLVIAIGPEGGWVPFELDYFTDHGFKKCSLGPWPLRVEDAVISAMSQIELVLNKQHR